MSDYDREDMDVLSMPYKKHGPGGELPVIGSFQPVTKTRDIQQDQMRTVRSDVYRVRECAIHTIPTVALSAVVFYWQQSGQLAEPAGFYSLIVLGLVMGFQIGRIFHRS